MIRSSSLHAIVLLALAVSPLAAAGCASLVGLEDKDLPASAGGGAGAVGMGGAGRGGAGAGGVAGRGGAPTAGPGGSGGTGVAGHGGAAATGGSAGKGGNGASGSAGKGVGGSSAGSAGSGVGGKGGSAGKGAGGVAAGGNGGGGSPGAGGDAGGAAGDSGVGMGGIGGDTSMGGEGGSGGDAGAAGTGGSPSTGWVVYGVVDTALMPPAAYRFYRVPATAGLVPESISDLLDAGALGVGADSGAGVSPNGQWLAFVTERGCPPSETCLGITKNDATLSTAAIATFKMDLMMPPILARGRPLVSDDGLRVVFSAVPMEGGMQLFTTTRADTLPGTPFELPVQLTTATATTHPYDVRASFEPGATSLLFDCLDPMAVADYDTIGGAVCEIGVDGTGFLDKVIDPSSIAGPFPLKNETVHGWKTTAGSILFTGAQHTEPSTNNEQIYQRDSAGTVSLLSATGKFGQEAPCVFPDQRVAFLDFDDATVPMGVAVSIAASPATIPSATPIALLTAASSTTLTFDRYISCGGP